MWVAAATAATAVAATTSTAGRATATHTPAITASVSSIHARGVAAGTSWNGTGTTIVSRATAHVTAAIIIAGISRIAS
jgi:hypothetical protein